MVSNRHRRHLGVLKCDFQQTSKLEPKSDENVSGSPRAIRAPDGGDLLGK